MVVEAPASGRSLFDLSFHGFVREFGLFHWQVLASFGADCFDLLFAAVARRLEIS